MLDIDEEKIRKVDGTQLLVLRELLLRRRTTLVAKRLGLSQSGVSHALARLRALFDDELFIRRPHGLEPTPHALDLAPRIDALLEAMGDSLGLSTAFDPALSNRAYRIGAPDHVATRLAPRMLTQFSTEAPNARLAFSQRLGRDALTALGRRDIDLALGRFRAGLQDFVVETVLEEPYCLVARRDHPTLQGPVTRQQWEELTRVEVSPDGDFRSLNLAGEAVETGATVVVPRFLIALSVVASGDAVTVVPRGLAERFLEPLGLQAQDLPSPVAPLKVVAVRRPHQDAATDWLLSQVKAALAV